MNSEFVSTALTGAGLVVGVALLGIQHYRWWKTAGGPAGGGSRDPKALIPTWFGVSFGTLMVACPAGLLGTASGFIRWGGNSFGDFVMSTMTGQRSNVIASAATPSLDGNGALVVTALVISLFTLRKAFAKVATSGFKTGVFAGTLLAIGTGVFAVIGNAVIPAVNSLGAQLIGSAVTGTFL
ncbi:hypothetical protein [Streptomyces subrutilus]|uniref:hypothetical protein n=1 Tax=Streptomyces subrutilus TaxID=36818 RepID=UPI002E151B38|nr:hypothetical protein OG479_32900 [Streptomyces subrutilus]